MGANPEIEYLAIDFDAPPSSEQLSEDFGVKGWQMISLIPVSLVTKEGAEPLHKLRAYFVRPKSEIVVPTSNRILGRHE